MKFRTGDLENRQTLTTPSSAMSQITGAGYGMGGCRLDLEIGAGLAPGPATKQLRAVLTDLGIEECATVNVSD